MPNEPLGEHYIDSIKVIEGFLKTMRYHVQHPKPHRIQQDARSIINRCCDLIEYATADTLVGTPQPKGTLTGTEGMLSQPPVLGTPEQAIQRAHSSAARVCVCGHPEGLHAGMGLVRECCAGAFTDASACTCALFIDRGWARGQIIKSKWNDTGPVPSGDWPTFMGSEILRKMLADGEVYIAKGRIQINNCAVANAADHHDCGMCDGGPCPLGGTR